MQHAFIMSVHTNFDQIKRLVKSLSFGDIYIHVDLKKQDLYTQLVDYYKNFQNVYLIENRVSVNWSGFSQVQATLNLLNAVKDSDNFYDYIHFISGQDLLLLSPDELDAYLLKDGSDQQFIDVEEIGKYWWRLRCYTFFRENPKNRTTLYRCIDICLRLLQFPFVRRKNFKGYDLYKGSSWFSITYDCLNYILDTVESTSYKDKFRYTACSDEHFFQVLLMNSKYKNAITQTNGRYVIFDGLNASPRTLTVSDYDDIMNGKYMFARKFSLDEDSEVIDRVLEKISR